MRRVGMQIRISKSQIRNKFEGFKFECTKQESLEYLALLV
jgi:hypothetical protein